MRFLGGFICLCGSLFVLSLSSQPDLTPIEEDGITPIEQGINWVKLGCTPPVSPRHINTGCGCCFAIVAVQNLESVVLIETGKYSRLSVQEVIDCLGKCKKGLLYGCKGGFMSEAFTYMMMNGLASDIDYPINLIRRQGPCQAADKPRAIQPADKPKPGAIQVIEWDQFLGHDDYVKRLRTDPPVPVEDQFKIALFTSPLSVRFNVNKYFVRYDGKTIIEHHQCPPPRKGKGHNHALLLVGFGTDSRGNKFWLVQNTWGAGWGRNGYALLRRGGDPRGVGGITAGFACRPVIKKSP
ncbi:hypothetical protein VPH35_008394 [Triticum aestivum]|uniref:ervatamin-B isoform X1 n=1 Tax=Triticum aestivum TaxID=4565 RepID=UPI000E7B9683|nr:ervatamin-B-like isoform X1 [Triticum aestivum]